MKEKSTMTKESDDDWTEEGIVKAMKLSAMLRKQLADAEDDSKNKKVLLTTIDNLNQKIEIFEEQVDSDTDEDKKFELFNEVYEEFKKMDDLLNSG